MAGWTILARIQPARVTAVKPNTRVLPPPPGYSVAPKPFCRNAS
jgi:hypothetical protein